MKKLVVQSIVIVIIVLIASTALAQKTEIRDIDRYSKLKVLGNTNYEFVNGKEGQISIDADGVDLYDVITKVSGETLIIDLRNNRMLNGFSRVEQKKYRHDYLTISIDFKNVKEVTAGEGSRVLIKPTLDQHRFHVTASTGSFLQLEVDTDDLHTSVNTGAELKIKGFCESQFVNVSTGGNLEAQRLECNYAEVKITTGGIADIYAKESIMGNAILGGTINYRGHPNMAVSTSLGGEKNKVD